MATVVLTIHLLLAFGLIVVVLLQRSEGGGLGIGGGGVMTGRGAATALSKLTWALGASFVVTSLALTVIAAREAGLGSVVDQLGIETPEGEIQLAPAPPEEDLLAPALPDDGPAVPPPAQ